MANSTLLHLGSVYPRVCGGTPPSWSMGISGMGLSPRVWGNPTLRRRRQAECRSIPACAGEPAACLWLCRRGTVYPRVCGGTHARQVTVRHVPGLSPRVRGNRVLRVLNDHPNRSIPACAGEPAGRGAATEAVTVYPRVCGGTHSVASKGGVAFGLSPRVRGEPIIWGRICGLFRVYPRVCGGTPTSDHWPPHERGLSPRVRGNRCWRVTAWVRAGSIPACAGEPLMAITLS